MRECFAIASRGFLPPWVSLLREQGMKDTLVVLGGIVPQEDIPKLKEQGIAEIFLPGQRRALLPLKRKFPEFRNRRELQTAL